MEWYNKILVLIICHCIQTGSGKTYTMGSGFREEHPYGIIPQVMDALFEKIKTQSHQSDFQIRVSFIEVCQQ